MCLAALFEYQSVRKMLYERFLSYSNVNCWLHFINEAKTLRNNPQRLDFFYEIAHVPDQIMINE